MPLPEGFELVTEQQNQPKLPEGFVLVTGKDQESPSMQAGRRADISIGGMPIGSSVQGAINALQGPTFGFLDELAGAVASPFGKYKDVRDYIRGATEQFRKYYPVTAATTSAMTAAPTMMLGGGAASAAPVAVGMLPKVLQAARVGGIQGAISGAGESTAKDLGGVVADIAKGGAGGAALGGAGQGALGAGGAVVSNVAQRYSPQLAQNAATAKLAEALMRGAPEGSVFTQSGALSTPAGRAAARIERFGPEATIADVSGQAPKQLLDVLATLPGKTKDTVEQLIRGRQSGRAGRIMTAADDALGTKGKGYTATLDALESTQKANAAPLYDALEGVSVRVDKDLYNLLQRAPEAHKAAEKLARTEGKVPIDLSTLKVGDDVPFDAIDTMKKTLWQLAESEKPNFKASPQSRAYDNLRTSLTQKMDDLSPKDQTGNSIYKLARDAFAGPAELKTAIETGRTSMKVDSLKVAELTKGMSASELEAFRVGALQSLRDKVGTEAGQTSLLKMWKEPATSDKLREIFGNDYRKFSAEIAKEGQLKALEATGRGSQTAGRLYAAGDLDNQALLDAAQAAKSGITGNLVEAAKSVGKSWNSVALPETTRNELAKMLMSKGSEAKGNLQNVDQLIKALNANAATRAAFTGGVSGQIVNKLGTQQ
tara:strand:- start:223 stop:2190 length:1968 start_codon:yes stop_codon:yes gene_type:complete